MRACKAPGETLAGGYRREHFLDVREHALHRACVRRDALQPRLLLEVPSKASSRVSGAVKSRCRWSTLTLHLAAFRALFSPTRVVNSRY